MRTVMLCEVDSTSEALVASISVRLTKTDPFAELETLLFTICGTEPASGAGASGCAIPSRAILNVVSRPVCLAAGGNIVADTASEPLTF
jgi:hypothetical protein